MEIKVLQTTSTIEDFFNVRRNMTINKKQKSIYLLIIAELILLIINLSIHTYYKESFQSQYIEILFVYINIVSSIVIILSSSYYASKYKMLLMYLDKTHLLIKDIKYIQRLDILHRRFLVWTALFMGLEICCHIYIQYTHLSRLPIPGIWKYIFHGHLCLCSIRNTFQFLKVYAVLSVMSEQLECVTRSLENSSVMMEAEEDRAAIFEEWCVTYTNIRECSKLFYTVFGMQLTEMIGSIALNYIIFIYSMTLLTVKGIITEIGKVFYVLSTLALFINLLFVTGSAQRVHNCAATLRRRIGRLLVDSLPNEDRYKSTKDLSRLISICPISTETFGSISVDMTLIPSCVVFFTSYTVIALQFNNVV